MFQSLRSVLETATAWLAGLGCVALLAIAPWVYGGVEHWFRALMAAGLAACLASVAVAAIVTRRPVSPIAVVVVLLPLAGWLALAAAQLWGGVMPIPAAESLHGPATIYPAATRLGVAGLLAAIAAALLGGVLFSERSAFHGLLAACLMSAAAVAFGGIALRLTGDDRIIRGLPVIGDPFARFVNRNNAAAFLAVGIAAGLALLRSVVRQRPVDESPTLLSSGWKSVDRTTILVVLSVLVSLCLAGVAVSRSRGGAIASVVAIGTGLLFFPRDGLGRRLLLVVPPIAMAALLVAWLGLSSSSVERFRSLTLDRMLADGRIPHWRDVTNAVIARPVFGAGLGTYGYSYQEFSKNPADGWYVHADNQFVEVAVETGAIGGVLLAGSFAVTCLALGLGRGYPVERVLLSSLVAGQAAHAVFDYGIIVPAVALPAAVLWGAAVGRLVTVGAGEPGRSGALLSKGVVTCAAVATAAGLYWSFGEHRAASAIERHASAVKRAERPGGLSADEVDGAIAALSDALASRPDDAEGQRALARLYLVRYRGAAADALRSVDTTLSEDAAWEMAGLTSLHRVACGLAKSGAVAGVDALRQDALAQLYLIPARQHLMAAAEAAPRLTGVRIPLAALAFLEDDGDVGGTGQLAIALRLFPADSDVLRTAGRMAWQAGDGALAGRCWQQAFSFGNEGYGPVALDLAEEIGAERAVELTVPRAPEAVLTLANDPVVLGHSGLRLAFSEKLSVAARSLRKGALRQRLEANASWLAGREDEAFVGFQTLLGADPLNPELRANLARFHWDRGNESEALTELRTAAEFAPGDTALRGLLATWLTSAKQRDRGRPGSAGLRKNRQESLTRP